MKVALHSEAREIRRHNTRIVYCGLRYYERNIMATFAKMMIDHPALQDINDLRFELQRVISVHRARSFELKCMAAKYTCSMRLVTFSCIEDKLGKLEEHYQTSACNEEDCMKACGALRRWVRFTDLL